VSYAGVAPVARESADKKRKDKCPRDCNVYLKFKWQVLSSTHEYVPPQLETERPFCR